MHTCYDHARDALHEGEEDDDGAVGVDVPRAIPDIHHPMLKQTTDLMQLHVESTLLMVVLSIFAAS